MNLHPLTLSEWQSPNSQLPNVQFLASFGTLEEATAKIISPLIAPDGSFTIDRSTLTTINNGRLPDGTYSLSLQAKDSNGNISGVVKVNFTLDSTPPEFTVAGIVDGIRWQKYGARFQGQILNDQPGTIVTYQLNNQTPINVGIVRSSDRITTFAADIGLASLPDGEHTLTLRSYDIAGNITQPQIFRFFIQNDLPIVDDDIWTGSSGGSSGSQPPGSTPPGGTTGSGTAGDWLVGYSGSAGTAWGNGYPNHSAGGSGGSSGGGSGSGGGSTDPTYLEKVALMLDQAVADTPQDKHKKAAIKNRIPVLMAIADMIDKEGLYDRMNNVFYDIYDAAAEISTRSRAIQFVQDKDGNTATRGDGVVHEIIADPKSIRERTYHAALVAVVHQVFADDGYTLTPSDELTLIRSLDHLSTAYARFNPTRSSGQTSSLAPDFLDSLWRAQAMKPRSGHTVVTELQSGITAMDGFLTGVSKPIEAIQFVSQLVQATANVVSLRTSGAVRDAQFIQELVNFGFAYAKLNPNQVSLTEQQADDSFLAAIWQEPVD